MSLANGIHVFYAGKTRDSVDLFHVLIDDSGRYEHKRAYLDQLPAMISGPSAYHGSDNKIHVFCTCYGYEIHEVTFDGTDFKYVGPVPNARSGDQTAVVDLSGSISLCYQNFNALERVKRSGTGSWGTPSKLVESNVYNGIGGTAYDRNVVLGYCGYNWTLNVIQVSDNGTVKTLSDSGAALQQTPALTSTKNDLYVLHTSQDSSNSLYYRHYAVESMTWGKDTQIGNVNSVGGGPAAVYINGNVISLTQGYGNTLMFQARLFHEWIQGSATVKIDGTEINNLWYSPAAVAVTAAAS